MTFEIERDELLKPLQHCLNLLERKHTLPILAYVLFDFSENDLLLTVTDTEVQLEVKTSLTIKNPNGRIVLPGHKLADICKGLSPGSILKVELKEDKKVVISSGRNRFTLLAFLPEDYPCFNSDPAAFECQVPASDLNYLLSKTHFAVGQQDIRQYLNGVLFEMASNTLTVMTTDGHRLALAERPLKTTFDSVLKALVPKKCTIEVLKACSHSTADWLIACSEHQIEFSCQDITITSKLIHSQGIDFKQLIPKSGDKFLEVSCQDLKQALELAAILSHEKSRGVRLEFNQGSLKVSANNPEYEAAETEIAVDFPYDLFSIAFNVAYLLDIINIADQASLNFSFSDANAGVLVQSKEIKDLLFVVMPLRL